MNTGAAERQVPKSERRPNRPRDHHALSTSPANRHLEIWAVVLAAGRGRRFGGRKQFARIGGRRAVDLAVAMITPFCDGVVVVIPSEADWEAPDGVRAVVGGETRSRSVRCGLDAVPASASIVTIHDAAHPLATPKLISSVIRAVVDGADAAVPTLDIHEAVRRVEHGRMVEDIPRSHLVVVQMPQAFQADRLRRVHASRPESVEDSWLIREDGGTVALVPGEAANVHIATPGGLEAAAQISGSRAYVERPPRKS